MLECATTLCIFLVALVIGVVIVQTVLAERDGLRGFDAEAENLYFGLGDL